MCTVCFAGAATVAVSTPDSPMARIPNASTLVADGHRGRALRQ